MWRVFIAVAGLSFGVEGSLVVVVLFELLVEVVDFLLEGIGDVWMKGMCREGKIGDVNVVLVARTSTAGKSSVGNLCS